MAKDQQLIDRIKSAVETINQCSDQLASNNIFVYMKVMSRDSNKGDRIELYDAILHKSLLKEPDENNDSQ